MAKKSFKETVQEELFKISEFDLADAIDQLKSDKDVREYIWANRAYFDKVIPADAMKDAPSFRGIVYGDPPETPLDLDKTFGKDWDKDFASIPYNKIEFVAEQKGLNPKELTKQMADIATQRERQRIAHGEDEGGWFDSPKAFARNLGGATLSLFGRRQQEAIARGEEPTAKDYAGDIAENSMYAIPWGRALGAVGAVAKGSKVARALTGPVGQYVIGNATAPIAAEAYDAAVYDNQNPRGEFSVGDVGTGIATNMAAPVIMQRLGGRYGTYIPFIKHMNEGGMIAAKSQGEIAADLARRQTPMSNAQRANTRIENMLRSGGVPKDNLYSAAAKFNADDKKVYDAVLKKIRNKEALTQSEWQYVNSGSHPELTDFYNLQYNPDRVPTGTQLAAEESVKNLITNEAPNVMGDVTLPWYTRIPGGSLYYEHAREAAEAEKQRKKEQEIEDKWKIRLGVR